MNTPIHDGDPGPRSNAEILDVMRTARVGPELHFDDRPGGGCPPLPPPPVDRPNPTRVLDERAPLDPLPRSPRERWALAGVGAALVLGWAAWALWYVLGGH